MTKRLYGTPKYWLTLDVCVLLFKNFRKKIEFNEPIPDFETRFEGKLEGILESISQTFDSQPLNPTILDAAASYFNYIIRGHPFKNGNKRMAVLFTHFFLITHGIDYTLLNKEMYSFAVVVARVSERGIPSKVTLEWSKQIISEFSKDL